jgi:hypothetical protein
MMRLYAGPKGREDEKDPPRRVRAAGLKQVLERKSPQPPLSKEAESCGFVKGRNR